MAALERRKTCLDYRSGVFDGLYQSWVKKKNQYCSGTFCGGLGGETGIASGHMNRKWPPCVFSLRSDSFAFSLPALRLIACSDFHTGASAPALVWLSKQALVLFFLSAPASIQLYRGGAQRSAFTPRRADTHTRIYSHSLLPPPTPYSSTGETPPTPGPERSSPPLKPGLHPAAHTLEQRSSPR